MSDYVRCTNCGFQINASAVVNFNSATEYSNGGRICYECRRVFCEDCIDNSTYYAVCYECRD